MSKAKKKTKNKTTKKKKIARKVKKNKAPIRFGLIRKEMDLILNSAKKAKQDIANELANLLPQEEIVSPKNSGKHHNVIVRNIQERAAYSPHVIDLNELAQKKEQHASRQHKIKSYLRDKMAERRAKEIDSLKTKLGELKIITATKLISEKPINRLSAPRFSDSFVLPTNWKRSFIIFMTLCLVVVLPIKAFGYYQNLLKTKDQIVSYANTAYVDLKLATTALGAQKTIDAEKNFRDAGYQLYRAQAELDNLGALTKTLLNILPAGQANLADAQYLLSAGQSLTEIGAKLSPVLNSFWQIKDGKLTDKISVLQTGIEEIMPQLTKINDHVNKIKLTAIPADKQELFASAKHYISTLKTDLTELSGLTLALNEILGKEYNRRYLVVFQNNNEIRPTGGFMGSLALIDLNRGQIVNLEIPGGGTYDFQGQLKIANVSPEPLHLVKPVWQLQDANWFPDFSASAKKIEWFYDKSGGSSVDGVIAINASLIPKLLKIVGPIAMSEYGLTLTPENFTAQIQKQAQFDYDKTTNKPKQILSDLAPELLKKLFANEPKNLLAIMQTLKTGLDERDIQLYFNNDAVQEKMRAYGWTGELKDASRDYLSVVNANIGGGKTDAFIKQNINLVSDVQENGEIINTVTIKRTHTGDKNDLFGRNSNVNFVRVYVPGGSTLLSASGFSKIPEKAFKPVDQNWQTDADLKKIEGEFKIEQLSNTRINDEFGKTVFGNWIQTDPGETQTAILQYKLPFVLSLAKSRSFIDFLRISSAESDSQYHSLYLQKQSGSQNTTYSVRINLPGDYSVSPLYPTGQPIETNQIAQTNNDNKDSLIAVEIEKK